VGDEKTLASRNYGNKTRARVISLHVSETDSTKNMKMPIFKRFRTCLVDQILLGQMRGYEDLVAAMKRVK